MHDGFSFEKSASVEETIVLDILEKLSDGLGTQFSSKAKTLLSKIKNSDLNPMYAKLPMENISDQLHNISQLEEAIVSKYTITCLYDFSTSKKKLELKPLKIANFDGFWYLIALDARNDKLKKYHLKSISNINLLTTQFRTTKKLEVSLDNAINIWFEPEHDPMEVELLLDAHAAKILKRKPIARSQRTLEEYRDGSVEISIMITHEMEILPIVKYWIPHIKIISPKALQERLLADIEKFHHEIKQT
jgi:predicted DNA-binding transcriptional regulator YafY